MSRATRVAAVSAAIISLGVAASAVATAEPDPVQPYIVGGENATDAPWAAQVYVNSNEQFGGFNCSGSIIASEWVLTAQHCLDSDGSGMRVMVGSLELGQGTESAVDRKEISPEGDIALLHLATPIEASYITLGDADPATGTSNDIYGWGRETPTGPPASALKTAEVNVVGQSTDAYGGPAVQSEGVNGSAWKGDSGGPQIADGVQVGVASTVQNQDGSNVNGTNNYSSVAASREWIRQTAGV